MEVCRLCLELAQENNFIKVENTCKSNIQNLLPEVNLDISSDPVVCNKCSSSLDELNEFKKVCSDSQYTLKEKSKEQENSNLSLREILFGCNSNGDDVNEGANEKYCRTCLESISSQSFTILKPLNPDAVLEKMMLMCLPELNLELCREPVMCEKCFTCLQTFHKFKTVCLGVEEKLKNYSLKHGTNSKATVNLHNVIEDLKDNINDKSESVSVDNIKDEKMDESESNGTEIDGQKDVKQEEMEIKMEEDGASEEEKEDKSPVKKNSKLDEIMKQVLKAQKQETHYSCSLCAFTMANKRHYIMHMLSVHTTFNEESRQTHFCNLCDYKTGHKEQMKKHIENEHMEKEKLNCPFCSFTSIYALNLRRHISIHEDMQDLVCSHPLCDFKTSYKYSLQRHEVKMHANMCPMCRYKNKNRSAIQKHLRTVHDVYEIYQCDACKFKSFNYMTLKRHCPREHKGSPNNSFTTIKKSKEQLNTEELDEVQKLFND